MYIERNIDKYLIDWMLRTERKPLIIRGARQVGKSSSVKNLSKRFKYFIEINFDENPQFCMLFEQNLSVVEVCEQIALITNTPIRPGETLLFFDEIQACLPAISMLRYFFEKIPDLHVISAGSLLEFALSELPSFAVGRVRSLFMYPLSFSEFLVAVGEENLKDAIAGVTIHSPLHDVVHQKLLSYYKKFLVIGGMPEAVSKYVASGDLLEVQRILNDLVIAMQADFAKYKSRVSAARLQEVYHAVALQMGQKFTYSFPNSTQNIAQVKEAIELLKMAGLIYAVTHSSSNGIPLGASINVKKTKYLILDTGIFQRILGLNISDLMLSNDFNIVNKGSIAELHVGLELLKSEDCYQKMELYYWSREMRNSQAEVDYVIQSGAQIIPVEVKAGTKGSMQSLYLFLKEKKHKTGCRLSLENFSVLPQLSIIPLYASHRIKDLVPGA
ncbi:MAG: AAA family ATPase [Saprospiraceae bacterium]|nr:AAA family ATPase [Saprospiraceae bacterium]